MAAGAALLQLSVGQLDNNGNAEYKYDKFSTAARKTRIFLEISCMAAGAALQQLQCCWISCCAMHSRISSSTDGCKIGLLNVIQLYQLHSCFNKWI
jgi:hypothetical protein